MMTVAAAGDTWGISGPAFLFLFFTAACVLIFAAMLHRALLFAGRRGIAADQLGPQQVAYLGGGDRLALYTALGGLRGAEAIGMTPDATLATTGPLPPGATPLDQAVYHAAGARIRPPALAPEPRVAAALGQLREGLERAGLVPTGAHRRAARRVPLALVGLLALGAIRLATGIARDKPVGFLVPLLLLVAVVTAVLLLVVPSRTRAAGATLRELRARNTHLSPASAPAYATYGAAGAAMGVALFGGVSLWALDPGFAEQAEIQRNAAWSGGALGGSGGGGGDGGGSCGGGGGGCGGGGCGGGGCGG